ncbi:MAG: ATP-binding protein [Spirochaetaceae bacterium]|jgi:anti-sigma regulatory factor (Ser/Thr protein kinase)|nr:ATP-binding protein [Spirochaetaceae bacterium]
MESFEKEIVMPAKVSELDKLQEWLGLILDKVECSSKTCSQIAVVTEEIFTNICRHAYGNTNSDTNSICVQAGMDGAQLVMRFEDSGAAFNPLDHVLPDISAPFENWKTGGLGIFFIKKWTDKISYNRTYDNKNQLTLYKTIINRTM